MLSLYEILKASKTGIAPDMWTALAGANFGGAGSGAEVKELTGILPLSFTADGTPLLDFLISGNMVQTGTPTSQNPIQPSECGDLETVGEKAGQYKIPISSASTPTPVYLGEVQTTRKIKKLVLTGEEDYTIEYDHNFLCSITTPDSLRSMTVVCSHIKSDHVGSPYNSDNAFISATGKLNLNIMSITHSVDGIKEWLRTEYANGTPVTVWYVLATETTGIVNEPLRKIGDYADTLSMEQAGVSIPTLHGNTVIDVMTELKPSEMYIKYQE